MRRQSATTRPLSMAPPPCGVMVRESVHSPAFRMRRERHDFHEVFHVLKGRLRCVLDGHGTCPEVGAGGFLALEAGEWHRLEDLSPATVIIVALSRDFVAGHAAHRAIWEALARRATRVVDPPSDRREKLESILRTLMAEQVSRLPGAEALQRAEALRLLAGLAREPDGEPRRDSRARVQAVVRRLREQFHEPWEVDMAARSAHLSRRRFVQLFREETGTSLIEMRNALRLDHAARLIAEGRATVIGAAFSCGFGDVSHFYRLFRRRFGTPPAEWRKARDGA